MTVGGGMNRKSMEFKCASHGFWEAMEILAEKVNENHWFEPACCCMKAYVVVVGNYKDKMTGELTLVKHCSIAEEVTDTDGFWRRAKSELVKQLLIFHVIVKERNLESYHDFQVVVSCPLRR